MNARNELRDALAGLFAEAWADGFDSVRRDVVEAWPAPGERSDWPHLQRVLDAVEPRWQPIETAPKDGTGMLIWGKLNSAAQVADCWMARWNEDYGWLTDLTDSYEEPVWVEYPEHWMPLPAAPTPEPQRPMCPAHLQPEPCEWCRSFIAAGL